MRAIDIIVAPEFADYELIDSGHGAKFERFGSYRVVRPDPRALWQPTLRESEWNKADANFKRTDPKTGDWTLLRKPPSPWNLQFGNLRFLLKPTSFKHVGIFPEQAANWEFIMERLRGRDASVLNLFAYTGAATLAAAQAGAKVTHVDAVKTVIAWARENAALSKLGDAPIRWIEEDAQKFVNREARRGTKYDAILMDPPRFGRGARGEIWKLEEHLPEIVSSSVALLSDDAQFFVINAYTADISSIVLYNLMMDHFSKRGGKVTVAELVVRESAGKRLLPSGILARWEK